jgi:hypothetical protein
MEYNLGRIKNSYTFKRECLEKQIDSIEVLVLGSSQIAFGVNPEFFGIKGFNLANVSQTLFYDTRLTLKYADKMPKLRIVIITVSYFSFGEQLYDGLEVWRDYCYSQFWDIDFPEMHKLDLARYSKIFLYTPKVALTYFIQNFHVDLIKEIETNGYFKNDTVLNNLNLSDSLGHVRVKSHDNTYKENRFNENKNDLELLVQELKKRDIVPVIITPPAFSSYYKYADSSKLKRNHEVINEICSKYQCNYFDYFTDKRFVKRDFHDNDHLNFIGAEKFSRIINDEILIKELAN